MPSLKMREILPFGKLSSRDKNEFICGVKIKLWINYTLISVLEAINIVIILDLSFVTSEFTHYFFLQATVITRLSSRTYIYVAKTFG